MANDKRMGFAAVAVFIGLVLRFWHPVYGFTEFLQLDAANNDLKIAAFHEIPVYIYPGTEGYDGAYYAQIAYHPLLQAAELVPAIDNLAYRARRILPPALAWILAAGRPGWIAQVYSVLEVAAWLVLAALLWRLLAVGGGRSWLAWLGVLFSAGALSCVRLALPDLAALTLIAGAMLAAERHRRRGAAGWLAAACLTRETSFLAVAGLWTSPPGLDEPVPRRAEWARTNFFRSLVVALPLLGWLAYIAWRVGPADQGWDKFTWPLAAFFEKWRATLATLASPPDFALALTTVLALIGLTVQTAYIVVRPEVRNPWWRIGAAYVFVMLFLGTSVWEGDPGAATRVLLPLTLAFNVLACRRNAAISWLVAGNLTVLSGLFAMVDAPSDAREIAAMRARGMACVARAGEGWYNVEHTAHHSWAWSGGAATLEVESWPRSAQKLEMEFSSRSLTPRTLAVRENGVELWRGAIGKTYRPVSFPFAVKAGRATLEFSTDSPGVDTGEGPSERVLAFDVRDMRVEVTR